MYIYVQSLPNFSVFSSIYAQNSVKILAGKSVYTWRLWEHTLTPIVFCYTLTGVYIWEYLNHYDSVMHLSMASPTPPLPDWMGNGWGNIVEI